MENRLKKTQEEYNNLLNKKGLTTMKEWARSEGKDIEGMTELLKLIENNDFALILLITEYNQYEEEFFTAYPNGHAEIRDALAKAEKDKNEFIEIKDPLAINLILSWKKLNYAIEETGKVYRDLAFAYNRRDTPEKIVLNKNIKNIYVTCSI